MAVLELLPGMEPGDSVAPTMVARVMGHNGLQDYNCRARPIGRGGILVVVENTGCLNYRTCSLLNWNTPTGVGLRCSNAHLE